MNSNSPTSRAGNRCGHDPKVPRLGPERPSPQGDLGLTNELAARWFHQPQNSPLFQGTARQIRSERREACLAVLVVILRHLDGPSFQAGLPTSEDGFFGLSLKTIAQESGLGLRRSQRAFAQLKTVNPDFLKNLVLERRRLAQNLPAAGPEGQP